MESFEELDFSKVETVDQIENYIKEQLGADFAAIRSRLSTDLQNRAEELTLEFTNIAPNGDYEKLLEDNDSMATFLKSEAAKDENWKLVEMQVVKYAGQQMLECIFNNKAVDDGTSLEGYVFLSKTGKIRHAFTQGNGKL